MKQWRIMPSPVRLHLHPHTSPGKTVKRICAPASQHEKKGRQQVSWFIKRSSQKSRNCDDKRVALHSFEFSAIFESTERFLLHVCEFYSNSKTRSFQFCHSTPHREREREGGLRRRRNGRATKRNEWKISFPLWIPFSTPKIFSFKSRLFSTKSFDSDNRREASSSFPSCQDVPKHRLEYVFWKKQQRSSWERRFNYLPPWLTH